ncbi:MAG: hypothetical protein MJ141_08930 [Clostridia bacterium]|nr:hypothetical protein [Clostridia bacterium]
MQTSLFENGTFLIGANYWASDAGILMWRDFREETIRRDLGLLAHDGVRCLRVFPLWPDFQPIEAVRGYAGHVEGYSVDGGETLLYENDVSAGMSEVALAHFEILLDIADEYAMTVIPSILTGWMSGRLFVPPALEGKNILTDPEALKWEARFVRAFVRRFREHPAVIAWCLGNECNCMEEVSSPSDAYLWTALISSAIRREDPSRPILSGMHSLGIAGEKAWSMEDQAENCDILTTHPYASPTYKSDVDTADSFRAVMHPACQTTMYADIAGKPALIEETGTFGEMYADEEMTARYARNCLFNAWAHDGKCWLWWIAFDQGSLRYHPFGYNNRASNYGLFHEDGSPKPILGAVKDFNRFLESFPYEKLPPAVSDGVILLSGGTSSWAVGSGAYYFGQKAGLNLHFCHIAGDIPDAPLYILPSLNSNAMPITSLERIMENVKKGSLLYLSVDSAFPRNLGSDFGFRIHSRSVGQKTVNAHFEGFDLPLKLSLHYDITPVSARVLAKDDDGTPLFTVSDYGRGKVFFLACPLEKDAFDASFGYEKGHHEIYRIVRSYLTSGRILEGDFKDVSLTEHPLGDGRRVIVACHNVSSEKSLTLSCKTPSALKAVFRGNVVYDEKEGYRLILPPNDAAVFEIG